MAEFKTQEAAEVEVFRNRIVGYQPSVDPKTLTPHPNNPKIHPENQKEAMRGALTEIGWIACPIWNQRTGRLIDGHERREEAIAAGQSMPLLIVDLSEQEEALALATLDPIGHMANFDQKNLDILLEDVTTNSEALASMLAEMSNSSVPTYENKGQSGDRQIERATICRIAVNVDDIKTVERALARTGVEDRGNALLALARFYLQSKDE